MGASRGSLWWSPRVKRGWCHEATTHGWSGRPASARLRNSYCADPTAQLCGPLQFESSEMANQPAPTARRIPVGHAGQPVLVGVGAGAPPVGEVPACPWGPVLVVADRGETSSGEATPGHVVGAPEGVEGTIGVLEIAER